MIAGWVCVTTVRGTGSTITAVSASTICVVEEGAEGGDAMLITDLDPRMDREAVEDVTNEVFAKSGEL